MQPASRRRLVRISAQPGDRSIPIGTTLDHLKALAAAGRPFEWRTYDGLDHGLSPRIWDDIGPWVRRFM